MTVPLRVLTITNALPRPGVPRTTVFIQRQVDYLRAAGVEVDIFRFDGGRRPWRYALAWLRFQARLMLARGRYDVIHAQFGQNALLALPKRLPLVVTFRGSDLQGIVGKSGEVTKSGRVLQWISRLVARRADAVVIVSAHMREYLPPTIDATVIPSGLDLALLRPYPRDEARRELGLPLDRALVLFAADPGLPRKRFQLAREAISQIEQRMPVELVVAWQVPHSEMPLYMSACDALILTSVHEGSPNVVKEALACNLPVVSVATGDVRERLRGIEGCELCEDDSPATIAAALERVLSRRERVDSRRTVEHLDEKLLAQQMIGVYERAVERRS